MTANNDIVSDLRKRLGFAGVSEKFLQIVNTIEQVAPTDISVLITGINYHYQLIIMSLVIVFITYVLFLY